MESFPYPDINRAALVLKFKKPFCDWVAFISRDDEGYKLKSEDIPTEGFDSKSVYLIPAFEDNEDYDVFLKENCEDFFSQKLEDWCSDPDTWPKDRSWEVFNKWFEYEIHTMIYDMIPEYPLEYEG